MTTALSYRHTYPGLLGRGVIDDLFGSFFADMPVHVKQTTQGYPVADIYRNDDGSTIMEFALAGFSKEDLTVEVKPEARSITVEGRSPEENAGARRIARRNFQKTYVNYDDNLDLTNAVAEFENGLLIIQVPTRPEVEPLSIPIK